MTTQSGCDMFFDSFPANPFELGAILKEDGVQFTLFTGPDATDVQLVLIPDRLNRDLHTVHRMEHLEDRVVNSEVAGWRVFVPEAKPGDCYGFRVRGPYKPLEGLLYNPRKVLCDPFGKLIGDVGHNDPSLYVYDPNDSSLVDHIDSLDSAPLSMVPPDDDFDWEGLRILPLKIEHRVVLEAHLKGSTKLMPGIDKPLAGTYGALSSAPVIERLVRSGATTLELLPIHQGFQPNSNYWNYNTLSFFAPEIAYSSQSDPIKAMRELKTAIRELHRNGIEVVLDVVFNHTVEGDHRGPTLCFRGVGNKSYYLLNPYDQSKYLNRSGVGNAINCENPLVILLILMSIKYWHDEFGIDGVRLDLGSLLFQKRVGDWFVFDSQALLFRLIEELLPKSFFLSTEPWTADGGQDLGRFPEPWVHWSGAYRDEIQEATVFGGRNLARFATRLAGSRDIFPCPRRSSSGQVVYAGSHDGFSLYDRFTFDYRRNWANGEQNRDGHHPDHSWNCGEEGPSCNPAVEGLRMAKSRLAVSLLLSSAATPMITVADLVLHSQQGNNNPYGQDNEVSWVDWENPRANSFFAFAGQMIALRKQLPALWSYNFDGDGYGWFSPVGTCMSIGDWQDTTMGVLAVHINGIPPIGVERPAGNDLYLAVNFRHNPIEFYFPRPLRSRVVKWTRRLDCTLPFPFSGVEIDVSKSYNLAPHGVLILESAPRD